MIIFYLFLALILTVASVEGPIDRGSFEDLAVWFFFVALAMYFWYASYALMKGVET